MTTSLPIRALRTDSDPAGPVTPRRRRDDHPPAPARALTLPTTEPADRPGPSPEAVAAAAASARKRRIAFASFVDENYLPGFLALLRSLALTNPDVCEDFLVLHAGLRPASIARIRQLHPRVRFIGVDTARYDSYAKGDHTNYLVDKAYYILDIFRVRDYDTIITLDTDMVVLGGLQDLLGLRHGLAAVPQFYFGQHKLNSGLLVINSEYLTDEFCDRIDAVGRSGDYELDKHDQGILNALLDGDFIHLDARYNFVKRRLKGDKPVPKSAVVLHFTGRHKPWQGGETGYAKAEAVWARYDIPDAKLQAEFLALKGAKDPDLTIHFGLPLVNRTGDVPAARKVAQAYLNRGEFERAVEILSGVTIPLHDAGTHDVYGQALMGVSRYQEARTQLLLAAASPTIAPNTYARLAQLEWVTGNEQAGRDYALRGMAVDPTHRPSRIWYARNTGTGLDARPAGRRAGAADQSRQLTHVAFYMHGQGNAGDKLLPETVRMALADAAGGTDPGPTGWRSQHAHRLFDERALAEVNRRRGLVIGGGGLFIPDTFPNGNSAWQWNIPTELLRAIDVPIAVYAVGFNAFDGQSYRRDQFTESLTALVEKASFFGLRNYGSIAQVRRLLPASLHEKVRFQPCPTTVIRQIYPGWIDPAVREDTILLNAAYDRTALRFGHDYDQFLEQMAAAVRGLGRLAEVRCVAHALDDERIAFDLRRVHGISLPVVPMYDFSTDEIRDCYARTKLVVGMRGHAGMIPFGCGTPIISLISHPKMAYFLADIDRPQWGISVHDRQLGEKLPALAAELLTDHDRTVADVHGRQQELWKITDDNAAEIAALFDR